MCAQGNLRPFIYKQVTGPLSFHLRPRAGVQKGSVDGVQNQSSFPLLQLALALARGSLKVPAKISQSIVAPTYNPSTGREAKAGEET